MSSLAHALSLKENRVRSLRRLLFEHYLDGNPNPSIGINLEIGSGHGHWLTSFAENEKESRFLGIDLITKRVAKANSKAEKRSLTNLRFLKADALEFMQSIPEGIVIRNCYLMYLDPWPKARHHKKRILNSPFLDLLNAKSSDDCRIYFRTDHLDFFHWSLAKIIESPFWLRHDSPWPHESESYFQKLLPIHYSFAGSKTLCP